MTAPFEANPRTRIQLATGQKWHKHEALAKNDAVVRSGIWLNSCLTACIKTTGAQA
jgi:hypothetical protein